MIAPLLCNQPDARGMAAATRVVPLTVRRGNGRQKILPPENASDFQWRTQDPHILKALGRAWAWRRKLESGESG